MRFTRRRLRIDTRAQALTDTLRYSLIQGIAEPLEAESRDDDRGAFSVNLKSMSFTLRLRQAVRCSLLRHASAP